MSVAEPSWPGAVLFDLDGTLIDSVPDIAMAVNELMAEDGLAPFSDDEVRAMVGHGLEKLVFRAYAARKEPEDMEARLARMRIIYLRHLTGGTVLMPGARQAVSLLKQAGWRLAVVTNKLETATIAILDHFGLSADLSAVVGDSGLPLKPEPDMLLAALSRMGVSRRDAVMVGDSSADILSAKAAGIRVIAVRGGYSAHDLSSLSPDHMIDSLDELPTVLPGLMATWASEAEPRTLGGRG